MDRLELRALIAWFVTISVSVALDPLVGIGYFYLPMHYSILCSLVWIVLFRRDLLIRRLKWDGTRNVWAHTWRILAALSFAGLLVAPLAMLMKGTYFDYELGHAGSRFANPFSIDAYFKKPFWQTPVSLYFPNALDFNKPLWAYEWMYLGWIPIFLVIAGLVLAKDRRKWLFVGPWLLLLSVQLPANRTSPLSFGHWLTVLTDPFHSTLRSFHMPGAFLSPTLLFPLVVLGAIHVHQILLGKQKINRNQAWILISSVVMIVVQSAYQRSSTDFYKLPTAFSSNLYLLSGAVLIMLSVLGCLAGEKRPWVRGMIAAGLSSLLAWDLYGLGIYLRSVGANVKQIEPSLAGLDPGKNPVKIDFQNPLVFPLRETYANQAIEKIPGYLKVDPHNMQGLFYRYTNMAKFFEAAHQYLPRHLSYAPLAENKSIGLKDYVARNKMLSKFVPYAVQGGGDTLKTLMKQNDDDSVVAIDQLQASLPELGQLTREGIEKSAYLNECQTFRIPSESFRKSQAAPAADIYDTELPNPFPNHLATSVFVDDHLELLSPGMATVRFTSAQGALIRPHQFDVQNFRRRHLVLSLPPGTTPATGEYRLKYCPVAPLNASNVLLFQPDHQIYRLNVLRDGWLILHQPYDEKWVLKLNGVTTKFGRGNEAFISFPLKSGENLIDMHYWPGSSLRYLLLVSYLLCLVGFGWCIRQAIRMMAEVDG